jgi:hypothetical protein
MINSNSKNKKIKMKNEKNLDEKLKFHINLHKYKKFLTKNCI